MLAIFTKGPRIFGRKRRQYDRQLLRKLELQGDAEARELPRFREFARLPSIFKWGRVAKKATITFTCIFAFVTACRCDEKKEVESERNDGWKTQYSMSTFVNNKANKSVEETSFQNATLNYYLSACFF